MKIRPGFVANSSSSSFILILPRDLPLTVEAVHAHLYGPMPRWILAPARPGETEYSISTREAAAAIVDRLAGPGLDEEQLLETYGAASPDAPVEPPDENFWVNGVFDGARAEQMWAEYRAACLARGQALWAQLHATDPTARLLAVEFCDYAGPEYLVDWVMRNAPDAFGAIPRLELAYG